jgi:predicted nucleic acid-binding Zn ribbon protein
MKSLRDSLGAVLGKVAVDLRSGAPLAPIWNEVVGELIAKHSKVRSLERGVLTVTCEPAWRAALEAERSTLLHRLRARVGESLISSVVFES